jgi:uncharacterized protein YegP (UPF0339 family)
MAGSIVTSLLSRLGNIKRSGTEFPQTPCDNGIPPASGLSVPAANNDTGGSSKDLLSRSVQKWVSNEPDCFSFEVYRTDVVFLTSILKGGGDWRWRLLAPNMAILAASAGYSSEAACLSAIEALQYGARAATVRRPGLT